MPRPESGRGLKRLVRTWEIASSTEDSAGRGWTDGEVGVTPALTALERLEAWITSGEDCRRARKTGWVDRRGVAADVEALRGRGGFFWMDLVALGLWAETGTQDCIAVEGGWQEQEPGWSGCKLTWRLAY